jgi:ubiquinone/menaquinone biosynthesis C-methylase UbiE
MHESHYIIRGGVEGRERLRLLARVMRPTTLRLFEQIGLRPGMRCLDVGCGGGDVAFDLAQNVGPSGRVVGVDFDETKLELARHDAAKGQLENVEFRRLDIAADALALGTGGLEPGFDVVYARFLLTHLQDPANAIAKMRRTLRPGGILVVEDIDMSGSFCHPRSAAFDRYVELYTRAARAVGADPNIGPRLPGLLAGSGLESVQMHVAQPAGMDGEVKLVSPITMENIAGAVLSAGLASQVEVDQIVAELYAIARDSRTGMSLPRVVQSWGSG